MESEGVRLSCFVACYVISLGADVARLYWPSRGLRWLATFSAALGLAAHTWYLADLALPRQRLPIATRYESLLAVSWLITLIYLYLGIHDRRLGTGIFLGPIILGLIGMAWGFYQNEPSDAAAGRRVVGVAHGLLLLTGTVVVLVALVAAIMYLVKVRQLKTGMAFTTLRLPSLERLDHWNSLLIHIAWPLLTIGIGLGLALRSLRWDDAKVITTSMAWLLFTILVHLRHQPENRGRRIAILTLIACVVVLVSVLGDPVFGTGHQSPRGDGP